MKLISKIEIHGFRSIKSTESKYSASLESIGNCTTFIGLNNSGKSNALRALNAFFSGHTESNTPLEFRSDYFRSDLNRKLKNKSIKIKIHFTLPGNFSFRKKLEGVSELLGGTFSITKTWSRNSISPEYYLNEDPSSLNDDDRQKVDQFLGLITFRYIPARVLPIELIKGEHQALRDVLIRRLGKLKKESSDSFDLIQSTSGKLIEDLARHLQRINLNIGDIRLATPETWADMIFAFGYRLKSGDIEIDDIAQGSGVQSLLMLGTLYLIDKDYFQKFGWKQAAIWAIEEPETSLHSSMEAQVASYLSTISNDPTSRLQIFSATHSDLMIQYSDRSFFVMQNSNQSIFCGNLSKKELLEKSSRVGASRYVHRILFCPLDPVILVDGKFDSPFFTEALKILRKNMKVLVTYLDQMDPSRKSGGEGQILGYLKDNKSVIRNRDINAPVIVALDWESRKKGEFEKLEAECRSRLKTFIWPEEKANPSLDKSFKGIERFYSDRLISIANENCPNRISTKRNGIRSIHRDEYEEIKQVLYTEIKSNGFIEEDIKFAKDFLEVIIVFIEDTQKSNANLFSPQKM